MKKRVKSILLVVFSVVASLFLFAGCQFGETMEEALANRNLTVSVTYYANGGVFARDQRDTCKIYYEADTRPLNIDGDKENGGEIEKGKINKDQELSREYFDFIGWYYAETDANGNYVKYDSEGNVLTEEDFAENKDIPYTYKSNGEKVDFKEKLQANQHYVFVAEWKEKPKYIVKIVCDEGETISFTPSATNQFLKDKGVTSVQNGDEVQEFRILEDAVHSGETDTIDVQNNAPFSSITSNHQLVYYYYDEACTKPLEKKNLDRPEDMTEHRYLYLRVLDKSWSVLRTNADIADYENGIWGIKWADVTKKYWVACNIDMSVSTKLKLPFPPMNYDVQCTLQGNGYVINGLECRREGLETNTDVSFFGEIKDKAKIENISFTNVKGMFKFKSLPDSEEMCVVFNKISANATVKNVSFQGEMIYDATRTVLLNEIKEYGKLYSLDDSGNEIYSEYNNTYEDETGTGNRFICNVTKKQERI